MYVRNERWRCIHIALRDINQLSVGEYTYLQHKYNIDDFHRRGLLTANNQRGTGHHNSRANEFTPDIRLAKKAIAK